MDERCASLQLWASKQLGWSNVELIPASTDASFRRYFRVEQGSSSYILMDSPPDKEDCTPFVRVSHLLL
ncbi:COG3178: Predicted phosphotransferase related to Ser/Thr protein kinases, partial [hydrothermal vent metagenome]